MVANEENIGFSECKINGGFRANMIFFADDILFNAVGIFIALAAVLLVYMQRSFQYWERKKVPYLPPSIPWGNFRAPFRRIMPFGYEVANMYAQAKTEGWKFMGIYSLTNPMFMPVDLELVKSIMTKNFQHFTDRGGIVNEEYEPITAHLLSIGGIKWRNLRTKLTPTFTSGKMRHMFETIGQCGLLLEDYLKQEILDHKPVDIKNILANYTTDIIGSCAFGLDCNSFKEPDTPFRRYGEKTFQGDKIRSLRLMIMMAFPALSKKLRLRFIDKDVEDFFTKMVKDTIEYREKTGFRRKDFLQSLIDIMDKNNESKGDGTSLTLNEIVAQSFVFFGAGFETSSTTMTFALFELATHPEIQEKVRDEIKTVLKKHNNRVTYDALQDLKYMGQVIDETLRLFPPVLTVTRQCVEDYTVPDTDIVIEKKSMVIIPIRGIHLDPEYYENPEVFDPERFNDENKEGRHPYAHIPFGEGPRMCIGMRFGLVQTKVGILSILKNFQVKLSSKTKLPLEIDSNAFIPTTKGGMWLDLKKL